MQCKTILLLVLLGLWPPRLFGAEPPDAHLAARKPAALLKVALEAEPLSDAGGEMKRLRDAAAEVVQHLGLDHLGAESLRDVVERNEAADPAEAERAVAPLRKQLQELYEQLSFQPVMEAERPDGFPDWTPVGKIELKEYPGYRMARFEMEQNGGENSAFMTLFEHIKTNKIEMTAPVQMEYQLSDTAKPLQTNMAFLYASKELGTVGKETSGVQVTDVPAAWVLSVGVRGPTNARQIQSAREALEAWLDRNRDRYEADGPLRVMGYNSPFVFGDRRYFEVQIPVQKKSSPEDEE